MKTPRKAGKRKPVGWDDELGELLRCGELLAYQAKHGHTRVPAKWPRHAALGNRVAHQRHLARDGTIEPDRARRLAA